MGETVWMVLAVLAMGGGLGVIAAMIAGLVGHQRRAAAARRTVWAEAAEGLGLTVEQEPALALRGDALSVTIEPVIDSEWTVVEITGLPPAFHAARLGKVHRDQPLSLDGVLDDFDRLLPDVLGTNHIGEEVGYEGDPAATLAYLDPAGRQLVEALLRDYPDTDLYEGRLHLTLRKMPKETDELVELVQRAREVAAHFAGEGVESRLWAGLRQASDGARRLACLQALLDGRVTARLAAEEAAASEEPTLRLEVAAFDADLDTVRALHAEGYRCERSISVLTEQDEAQLISLLGGPWTLQAARRLREVGTVRAVEPLHALLEEKTLIGVEAAGAVSAIHERLGPVDAGGLSLSEDGLAGALSEVRGVRRAQKENETS